MSSNADSDEGAMIFADTTDDELARCLALHLTDINQHTDLSKSYAKDTYYGVKGFKDFTTEELYKQIQDLFYEDEVVDHNTSCNAAVKENLLCWIGEDI